jgi:hypothetical protein
LKLVLFEIPLSFVQEVKIDTAVEVLLILTGLVNGCPHSRRTEAIGT